MWENILKRRPLNINKPEKDYDASLSDIKNNIEEFIIIEEILNVYVVDIAAYRHKYFGKEHTFEVEDYLNDTARQATAEDKLRPLLTKVQNGEISLIRMLRRLKRDINSARKNFRFEKDSIPTAKIVEEIDNILSKDKYILIDQDIPFIVERHQIKPYGNEIEGLHDIFL